MNKRKKKKLKNIKYYCYHYCKSDKQHYRLKDKYKNMITYEIMSYFKAELERIFSKNLINQSMKWEDTIGMDSTCGWSEAFNNMCDKYNLIELKNHVLQLSCYDYDMFVGDFDRLFIKFGLLEEKYSCDDIYII